MTTPRARPELSVGFILCPEFPLMSLTGFVEALRHAADIGDTSRKILCSWTIMTPGRQPVHASCGIPITPDAGIGALDSFDCVAVIGPLLRNLETLPPEIPAALQHAHQQGKLVAGLCTGSFVLAEAGLMQKRRACLHPYHAEDYRRRYPDHRFMLDQDFHEDSGIVTVPGGLSVISFATSLISRFCGRERATKAVFQMTMSDREVESSVKKILALGRQHITDHRLRKAITLMERDMQSPGTVTGIAEQLGMSERQLERLFRDGLGTSPKAFWIEIRLRYGRWYLFNTRKAVTEVAYLTGFSDCAHFIAQFRKAYGVTPGQLRKSVPDRPGGDEERSAS
ncbi:MAG: helix-turn-helix domain-containing protein [Beijerinckiaceae bacterium]|nr:helix-turn-helix domain-containing protein [Beijerinckiaceae bacterium]